MPGGSPPPRVRKGVIGGHPWHLGGLQFRRSARPASTVIEGILTYLRDVTDPAPLDNRQRPGFLPERPSADCPRLAQKRAGSRWPGPIPSLQRRPDAKDLARQLAHIRNRRRAVANAAPKRGHRPAGTLEHLGIWVSAPGAQVIIPYTLGDIRGPAHIRPNPAPLS